jgi:hypothetical protein
MEEKLAEILVGSVTAVFGLGGVLFLKVAILGGQFWPPADSTAQPKKTRILCALAAAALIGIAGTIAMHALSKDKTAGEGASSDKVGDAKKMQLLTQRVETLERSAATPLAIAAVDTEIRTLRARVSVGATTGNPCAAGGSGAKAPADTWTESPSTPCEELQNAQWVTEIQGYLSGSATSLTGGLDKLHLKYAIGPKPADFDKVATTSLGMVFDEDASRQLICEVNAVYTDALKYPIPIAITQKAFLTATRKPSISSYGIRLGVAFDKLFKSYYHMTPNDWKEICKSDEAFARLFRDKAVNFVPLEPAQAK